MWSTFFSIKRVPLILCGALNTTDGKCFQASDKDQLSIFLSIKRKCRAGFCGRKALWWFSFEHPRPAWILFLLTSGADLMHDELHPSSFLFYFLFFFTHNPFLFRCSCSIRLLLLLLTSLCCWRSFNSITLSWTTGGESCSGFLFPGLLWDLIALQVILVFEIISQSQTETKTDTKDPLEVCFHSWTEFRRCFSQTAPEFTWNPGGPRLLF